MIPNRTLFFPRTLIDMMHSLSLNARGSITSASWTRIAMMAEAALGKDASDDIYYL
jgi:hypothetical protein